MKIIAIGDVHGRSNWQHIRDNEEFDEMVFIGDYFDTHEGISPEQQAENFSEILGFATSVDNVHLLIGNHDFHYIFPKHACSGFQERYIGHFGNLLASARAEGVMKMAKKINKHLFTHAGVSTTWLTKNNIYNGKGGIDKRINDLFEESPDAFSFQVDHDNPFLTDMSGDNIFQSPIWIRPQSLMVDAYPGITHVVGHSTAKEILVEGLIRDMGIILIDTILTSNQYLVIEDGVERVRKIPDKYY